MSLLRRLHLCLSSLSSIHSPRTLARMNVGGGAPVSSPSPLAGRPANSRASSALAAVSVALILLYMFWRFVWQCKKHAATNDGLGAASSTAPRLSSSSSCPSRAAACDASVDVERGEDGRRTQFPMFVHVATPGAAGADEKTECAVCLVEFAHGEAGRLVPGCGHGFHAACIETWFRVRSTCPLCRAAVVEDRSHGHGHGPTPTPRLERG
uniref:Uncharacterized protein n=1 Tax=Avena sativa TaxID=4498 RepID=A0ACD5XPY7_AVESA